MLASESDRGAPGLPTRTSLVRAWSQTESGVYTAPELTTATRRRDQWMYAVVVIVRACVFMTLVCNKDVTEEVRDHINPPVTM